MPSNIKKFSLTYAEVPETFDMEKEIFFNTKADDISENVAQQSPEQKQQIDKTVEQIKLDHYRTSYVDLDGRNISEIKNKRLMTQPNGELTLAPGVYPDFTQASDTGRIITETIYTNQYYLNNDKRIDDKPTYIGFNYINAQGEPAGCALCAEPTGEHKGWILATIQNTTAPPTNRTVTVLATPNYTTSKAQSTVSMDHSDNIKDELKAAIRNDKIAALMQGVFHEGGSLHAAYLSELQTRLPSNANLDDRDRKQAQLNVLFGLADKRDDKILNAHIQGMKQAIIDDINFFKTGLFNGRLQELLQKMVSSQEENEKLQEITSLYADIKILAEEHLFDPTNANSLQKIAQQIKEEITLHANLDRFYQKNPWAITYNQAKKRLDDEKQEALAKLNISVITGFFDRNLKPIGYALLVGSLIGLTLGLALSASVLPPLSITLLVISVALVVSGGLSLPIVYSNEKQRVEEIEQSKKERRPMILTRYNDALNKLRDDLLKAINTAEEPDPTAVNTPKS